MQLEAAPHVKAAVTSSYINTAQKGDLSESIGILWRLAAVIGILQWYQRALSVPRRNLGQHHQHHWGPVSPFARLLSCLCTLGKHETGLAFIAQAKPCNMCMLHGFWARFALFSALLWLVIGCLMREMWLLLAADLQKQNAIVG